MLILFSIIVWLLDIADLILKQIIIMRFYTFLFLIFPLFSWSQSEVDSMLINSENQFRDSIAAINLAVEQQQLLEENFNAATDFMISEDYINAIKSLNQVLSIDSTYVDAFYNRAICNRELNNFQIWHGSDCVLHKRNWWYTNDHGVHKHHKLIEVE